MALLIAIASQRQRQQNRMYLLFTRWQPWQPVTTQQQNNKTSLLSLRFTEVHFINKRRRFYFTARKKELQQSKHNATICVHYSCDISDNCQQCSTNKWYVCSQVRYELKSFVHTHTHAHMHVHQTITVTLQAYVCVCECECVMQL